MAWSQRIAVLVVGTIICLVWGWRVWFWMMAGSFLTILFLLWTRRHYLRAQPAAPLDRDAFRAYYQAVENHIRSKGEYDNLLHLQATDRAFLKGFGDLCRAAFTQQKPIDDVGLLIMTAVEDYDRLGRDAALRFLEESTRITMRGVLLRD